MPRKPKKPCKHPGCPKLVDGMYCEEHASLHGQERGDSAVRGYDSKWRKARERFLKCHPLCVQCQREGLWKRLWLTTSNRIGVIRFCFGMRVTGSRFASTTMTWRQWPRTGIRNINIDCVSYTRVGVLNLHNPVQDWPPPPQTWIFAELSRGDSPAVWYFSQNVFKCKGNPSESFDKKYRKTVFLMGKKAQKEVLFYPFFMPVWMEGCERIWRSSRQSR